MEKIINWSGYEWRLTERYGAYNEKKPFCHYSEKAVSIHDDMLMLRTLKDPKEFIIHGDKRIINTGIGLISSLKKFSFGTFEVETKLPTGNHLWPAFWMWSWESYPPEIDIFEGYSNRSGGYFKLFNRSLFGFWNIQTNIYYKGIYKTINSPTNKSIGNKTHFMGFKNPRKHFIKYKLEWFPNKITFYYNDKKVREITDTSILRKINGNSMNVIINNSVTKDANTDNPPYSSMFIKNFKYKVY